MLHKVRKMIVILFILLSTFGALGTLMGCEDEGPIEKVGDQIEEAGDEVEDATD